jgi:hypothetical protein
MLRKGTRSLEGFGAFWTQWIWTAYGIGGRKNKWGRGHGCTEKHKKMQSIPFSPTVISILVDSESSASIRMSVERKTRCVMFHVQDLIYSGFLIQFIELRIIGIDFQYSNIL